MADKKQTITPTPVAEPLLQVVSAADVQAGKALAKEFAILALTSTMDYYAVKLATKDLNTTGADDAIAAELHAFSSKLRLFQITGVWPTA